MDRLLVLHLQASGCVAEAWLNGIPLARVTPERPRLSLSVHEFTQSGQNRLELLIASNETELTSTQKPQPQLLRRALGVALRLQLQPCDGGDTKNLAQLDWAPEQGTRIEIPTRLVEEVLLPVSFPRWRWLDAPLIESTPALHQRVLDWLQALAFDLSAGQFDSFTAATALRTEELALAYQLTRETEAARLLAHLRQLHAADRLQWQALTANTLRLRPVAGTRLVECLNTSGAPALQSLPDPDGQVVLFPLRLASVENRLYALR